MPTALRLSEHELTSDAAPGLRLSFGALATSGYITTDYPQVESDEGRLGDADRGRGDGVFFGEDYLGAKTITFNIAALADKASDPHTAVTDALESFESVWRDPRLRTSYRAVAQLRSRMTGTRTRVAYGRPRRYNDSTDRTTHRGHADIVCDFVIPDGTWYDDEESTTTLSRRFAQGAATGTFTTGGTRPTWPIFEITGQINNASITIDGQSLAFPGLLGPGDVITIDTRPWRREITLNGLPSPRSYDPSGPRLSDLALSPGVHTVRYDGTPTNIPALLTVRWRNAWSRW